MTESKSPRSGRPRRLLVVANRTLGGPELADAVRAWLRAGSEADAKPGSCAGVYEAGGEDAEAEAGGAEAGGEDAKAEAGGAEAGSAVAGGGSEVLVLVPATHSERWNAERFEWAMAGAIGTPLRVPADDDPDGERQALERLGEALERLHRAGVEASGVVGSSDPVQAVSEVLAEIEVDEVLISTLPAGISKWLGLDLPHRIGRRFSLPVRQVTASKEPPS